MLRWPAEADAVAPRHLPRPGPRHCSTPALAQAGWIDFSKNEHGKALRSAPRKRTAACRGRINTLSVIPFFVQQFALHHLCLGLFLLAFPFLSCLVPHYPTPPLCIVHVLCAMMPFLCVKRCTANGLSL